MPAFGHVQCPVCGHSGVPTDEGICPNNNCARHHDASITGVDEDTGELVRDQASALDKARRAFQKAGGKA